MKTFSPVRTTAMHRAQLALGARFREVDGWQVADAYTSADTEAMRARAAVGLADVSAGGKLGVRGEAVDALIVKVSGGGAPEPGRAGRVRLDGAESLLCRLAADELPASAGCSPTPPRPSAALTSSTSPRRSPLST
ncbi:MAG: hypothetical protein DMD82_02885 [Candidatus Rokuibacteriota bacterium]|nr:MAG: hypothetical protein DMD82_02885 [Candidatus Rokubacteria bacterium]